MSCSSCSTAVISRSARRVDLQVEMTSLVGLPREPILARQDKERPEHLFQRHGHREQGKRKRIDRVKTADHAGIDGHPHAEPEHMLSKTGPLPAVHAIQSLTWSAFDRASRIARSHRLTAWTFPRRPMTLA